MNMSMKATSVNINMKAMPLKRVPIKGRPYR
jgi:hypothetical protein